MRAGWLAISAQRKLRGVIEPSTNEQQLPLGITRNTAISRALLPHSNIEWHGIQAARRGAALSFFRNAYRVSPVFIIRKEGPPCTRKSRC
ncbi:MULTISPECIES: hypothetical protein [unclassified Achromobacter]|uniref:hypothetical protein n=1 Tax=unclassified Achromobacter TaxID=2626865 RepID=UPI001C43930D|nr:MULTISPECIES: hypothetical protein [unclassified Achromobacter]MBV7501061.1 hypothetical protein [Achromobacter sp. ACM05]MCG7325690.1 hypothetical protein [Achromobacter sp. ACRQX]